MTKERYNPKTIGDYQRNYHIDNNLFVENESEYVTECHMGKQENKFFCFLVKTCTFIVFALTWQNSDKTHTTSTFSESCANRRSVNALGVRSGRLLIGDANISIEGSYEFLDDSEADLLRENYHSSKKHPEEIFLGSNSQKYLDDSIYINERVREDNVQVSENGNNTKSMTSESFDSLSSANEISQSNEAPNDQNELRMRFDPMQHYNNLKEDNDHEKQDESTVSLFIHQENNSRNDNNEGLNSNYNSLMNANAKESSGSADIGKAAGSSSPGVSENIFLKRLVDLKNYNNFKENCDETQNDQDSEMCYSLLQFDYGASRIHDNFKSSENVEKDVTSENMNGSNNSSNKQSDVPSANVSFGESRDTLKQYSDFQDKVNKIKIHDDVKEGLYTLKGVSNVNVSFSKIKEGINRNGGFNKNDNVPGGSNLEQNNEALSNNEDLQRRSDVLDHDNAFKREVNEETLGHGVNTQVEQQRGDAKEVKEIADKVQNEDNFENIFDKYRADNDFKELHSSLMRTVNMHKHFDKINDDDNYGKEYDSLRSDGSAAQNPQEEQKSDEKCEDLDEKESEKIHNSLEHCNALKEQVNEEKVDEDPENGVNILKEDDLPKNGVHPSKGGSQNGKKKSGKMNGRNNANKPFEGSRRDQNNYDNPVNRSPNGGRNSNNRNNIYRNNGSNCQNPLDVLKSEQDYSNENSHIISGMNKFEKQIDPSKLYESSDSEQSEISKNGNDESDGGEYADDEDEDEHAEGKYRRYDKNKKGGYCTKSSYKYHDNRINVLKQDEIAGESQELGEYNDRTELVTTVLESTGYAEEQFDEVLTDVVNAGEPLDVSTEDNTNASEQHDSTLKDNASVKEQLNERKNYQDNKRFSKLKHEERVSFTYDELDDDKRSHVTGKSRRIDNTYNGAVHKSKMVADRRSDITKKLKRIDGRDSDMPDHSKSGGRKSGTNGHRNGDKRNGKDSSITGNSKNDHSTSVISDKFVNDRNKKNSRTCKKDSANYEEEATELNNTDNYQNKLLIDMELADDFKRMFNALQNAFATKERFEALKHYEMFKKEILNIQLDADFEHLVNKMEPRSHTKRSLYTPKEEYEYLCDLSQYEDYFDSQSDRLTHNNRNKEMSNMKKKHNCSDRQSYSLGSNSTDKKELDKSKEGKYYEQNPCRRDNYDSKSLYSVLKKRRSLNKSFDKSNISTDYYNCRNSFGVRKDNMLTKEKSDKSKDGSVYYCSKTSPGAREGSNMEKKNLDKTNDQDDYYYGSKHASVSSKVNNDVPKNSYDKSRGTTDKCGTRSLYSVLSRNRSRRSLDKPGAPSNYYGSKDSSNASKENKMDKNISYVTSAVRDTAKPSNVLKDADSCSKRTVKKINNEEKGKGNDDVVSHSVKSFFSLKGKPQGENNTYNSSKYDQSNLDDLYDELDDAHALNKRYKSVRYSKVALSKLHDGLKYNEKEYSAHYKAVGSYENVNKKKSNISRNNGINPSKLREESEKDNDFLKSSYTFKRKSFDCKKSYLLKCNDKPMRIEQTHGHDRNYKDSNDKAGNNRKDGNREECYREGNNRRDERRRDDYRRNDNGQNCNRRNCIDDDYGTNLVNLKRNKKCFIKKVFSYIKGDEKGPFKSRMINKKKLFLKILKFIKKIDFMFELEMLNSMKRSIRSDTFLIKPETNLNKLFYYTKKFKIFAPLLLTLLCLFAFYLASLHQFVLGTGLIFLVMALYYGIKILKCHRMAKLFKTFSQTNKFEISLESPRNTMYRGL
ncbi:Pv-fam-d protein [Plasmodium coatneyi]|uniref:Pv-fam-d protein n=1 Tax=Plasmodium coatneyi TaxID=208452 RepID=A0A1B1DWP2_9APIC|nr:Pv-fam-d protein [Plasmodium coatneyi]ANQ07213.1 Pv-fam-d protein [Plasmodium coatneyi]